MDEVAKELRRLNGLIEKLTGEFLPAPDPGILGRVSSFRVYPSRTGIGIRGIERPDPVTVRELKGIDMLLAKLKENTLQFIAGVPCNNVLVYGTRGTGKSSAVKAMLNEYAGRGLKMIEVPKETLPWILDVADLIRLRPEKFIIFCDDLSFDEEDTSYRQIKTLLEGGLEMRPENMLIYATSNRRHLIPERMSDNLAVSSDGELHPSDTLEEKLSLSDRFGLRLGVHTFDMETYLGIVENYVRLRNLRISQSELRTKATQWSLAHGSFSGRTARQFVDDLEGSLSRRGKAKRR